MLRSRNVAAREQRGSSRAAIGTTGYQLFALLGGVAVLLGSFPKSLALQEF